MPKITSIILELYLRNNSFQFFPIFSSEYGEYCNIYDLTLHMDESILLLDLVTCMTVNNQKNTF